MPVQKSSLDGDYPEFKIEVSILKDKRQFIMIDTISSFLFKRGYREKGELLSRNMAKAILQLSNWYPDKPLIDPTCAQERSVSRRLWLPENIPGLRRSFAWEQLGHDRLIQEVRTEAAKKMDREPSWILWAVI